MSAENKLRKFKLIDKEGYLNEISGNKAVVDYFGEIFLGYEDPSGEIRNENSPTKLIIDEFEFKYFEEIYDDTPALTAENLYWQENTPLGAGLIVGKKCCGEKEFTVKYAGRKNVMLEDSNGEESTAPKGNLKSLIKSNREVMFEKVLSAWKGQTLDTAFDDAGSIVNLGGFFNVMYSVMK